MDHVHGTQFDHFPGGTIRVLSIDDDTESSNEFEFQTSNLSQLPPVSGDSPADRLFNNGQIVPLERSDGCDSLRSEKYKETGEADEYGEDDDELEKLEGENKALSSSSSSTDAEVGSEDQQVSMKDQKDQKLIDTRKNSILDSTVLNGFVELKKLMKHRARRIRLRLTFISEAKSHNTKVKQATTTTTTTTTRSSFYTNSWKSFFNWLFLRSDSKYDNNDINNQMKPRIVEINGQGPMKEVLDVLTAGRLSTDSKNGLVIKSGNRPRSAPASPLHMNSGYPLERDNRCEEREISIISAISFCKRFHKPKEREMEQ